MPHLIASNKKRTLPHPEPPEGALSPRDAAELKPLGFYLRYTSTGRRQERLKMAANGDIPESLEEINLKMNATTDELEFAKANHLLKPLTSRTTVEGLLER
ncbi:unnamed protein product [Toxocara canis]|uniref:DUF1778 domain-containing protein n=1 Tax=Toxocara canis TaxID=6265 RepID=A0A183UKX5_TOXCA|nr:unnamed protein product [Toxocara canis]